MSGNQHINTNYASGDTMGRLISLENRTGYRMEQFNGQRKYWNPQWNKAHPPRGCEVFVGKIPRDCYEDELVPVFEKIGEIYELRLMMDFSGFNRGYAFVQFTAVAHAEQAVEQLDNYEIRPDQRIGVCKSVDNCRLFVSQIPKTKTQKEIHQAMSEITEEVEDVIVQTDPKAQPGEHNRGFAFVEYTTHRAAAMARRKLIPGRIKLFDCEIAVDWADPEIDENNTTASRIKNVYVGNLKTSTSQHLIEMAFSAISRKGSIEKVKKIPDRDYGFVHFASRKDAEHAIQTMNGCKIDGQEIHVSFARPPSKSKDDNMNAIINQAVHDAYQQKVKSLQTLSMPLHHNPIQASYLYNNNNDLHANGNINHHQGPYFNQQQPPMANGIFKIQHANGVEANINAIASRAASLAQLQSLIGAAPPPPPFRPPTPQLPAKPSPIQQALQQHHNPLNALSYPSLAALAQQQRMPIVGHHPQEILRQPPRTVRSNALLQSMSENNNTPLAPVSTLDHIAKIECPIVFLDEISTILPNGSRPTYTLLTTQKNGYTFYTYKVTFMGEAFVPPASMFSRDISDAKKIAAYYVYEQTDAWIKKQLTPSSNTNVASQWLNVGPTLPRQPSPPAAAAVITSMPPITNTSPISNTSSLENPASLLKENSIWDVVGGLTSKLPASVSTIAETTSSNNNNLLYETSRLAGGDASSRYSDLLSSLTSSNNSTSVVNNLNSYSDITAAATSTSDLSSVLEELRLSQLRSKSQSILDNNNNDNNVCSLYSSSLFKPGDSLAGYQPQRSVFDHIDIPSSLQAQM